MRGTSARKQSSNGTIVSLAHNERHLINNMDTFANPF